MILAKNEIIEIERVTIVRFEFGSERVCCESGEERGMKL